MKKLYTVLTVTLMAISTSAQMTLTVDSIIEDPCPGGNKGAIEITVTGGTAPYTFDWEGPFDLVRDTEDIYDITGGDWNLTVYDNNQLNLDTTIFVPVASGMLTSITMIDSNRTVVEYVLNGNGDPADYMYIWEFEGWQYRTAYQDTLTGLAAGNYTLVVIDLIGCTDTLQLILAGQPYVDTVEVIKFTEVAEEAVLINPVTQATIWVKNFGDYIRTSESFDLCKVYNMTGSVVRQVDNDTDIPVSDLETGIYIFCLEFGRAEIVQRFYIK